MYTLKQIEAFYWSSLLGSFSASAKKLHATQSAIAKRVTELEAFVGDPLLERRPGELVLTQHGRRLFGLAEELLELNSRILQKMVDPASFEGVLRLGATELVGLTWLAKLIDQVNRHYPRIQLLPEIDGGVTLYNRLGDGALDLVIMPGPFWSYEYDCVPLASVHNVWMASPKLELDANTLLSPHDLVSFPVITQPTNSALSHLYDAWFTEQGLSVNRVLTCNSLGVVAQLTMLGLGVSYLPSSYFAPLVDSGELRKLSVTPDLPRVHYYVVYKKSVLSPLQSAIIELARQVCDFELPGTMMLGMTKEK